jgi:ATPase family protein associated with various cellular activities (AAA)/winged helix domain-containing protein
MSYHGELGAYLCIRLTLGDTELMNNNTIERILHRIARNYQDFDQTVMALTSDDEENNPIQEFRESFPELDLSDEEIQAIASIHFGLKTKPEEVTSSRFPEMLLKRLVSMDIVELLSDTDQIQEDESQHNESGGVTLAFQGRFLEKLCCNQIQSYQVDRTPFESLHDYYNAWFSYINKIENYSIKRDSLDKMRWEQADCQMRNETDTELPNEETKLNIELGDLLNRTTASAESLPLEILCQQLGLDGNERNILLYLLRAELIQESCHLKDILAIIDGNTFELCNKESYLCASSKLRLFGLISIERSHRGKIGLRSDVCLTYQTKEWLLTNKGPLIELLDENISTKPYLNNSEYMNDWLKYIRFVMKTVPNSDHTRDDDEEGEFGISVVVMNTSEYSNSVDRILRRMKNQIEARSQLSQTTFAFQQLISKHCLSEIERDIILVALTYDVDGECCRVRDVIKVFELDVLAQQQWFKHFGTESKLVKNDLISEPDIPISRSEVLIARQTRNMLMGRESSSELNGYEVLNRNSVLQELSCKQTLSDLVLPQSISITLQEAVHRCNSNTDELLRSWKLLPPVDDNSDKKSGSALTMIFSGLSGTGKTYAAGALANTLGRKIVFTDASKLLSKWVGDSQKNVSKLFESYQKLVESFDKPPVLVLNECDQLLDKRSLRAEGSVDKMYNQMVDLFLDRIEKFDGVLIATTNLVESLDDALSRRFHYKIVFPFPDEEARLLLWKKHLRPPIPVDNSVDLALLAKEFKFNGGQISVVAYNAAVKAAIRGDAVTMEDFIMVCRNELNGSFETKTMAPKQIGFTNP